MTCAEWRAQFLELLYDELLPEARASLEAHVETCPDCRDELDALRGTLRVTRAALQGPLDEPVPTRIAAAVRAAAVPQPASVRPRLFEWPLRARRRPLLLPLLAAAAAVTIALSKQIGSHSAWPRVSQEQSDSRVAEKAAVPSSASPAPPRQEAEVPLARDTPQPPRQSGASDGPRNPAPAREMKRSFAVPPPVSAPLASDSAVRGAANAVRIRALARWRGAERSPADVAAPEASAVGATAEGTPHRDALRADAREAPLGLQADDDARADRGKASDTSVTGAPVRPMERALTQRIERADAAFQAQRYADAAAQYLRLLRDYPKHRDVAHWKQRLRSAEAALR